MFIAGLNSPTTYIIGFGYLQELVGNNVKDIYALLWNISEGLIFVYATIYYWQINHHWFYLLSFGYLLALLSMIGSFFLPESPVFLINAGRLSEAKKSLEFIAKFNKRELVFDENIFPEKQDKAEQTIIDPNIGQTFDNSTSLEITKAT